MSSPKLRLLLDESITNPLAKGIQRLSRSAVYVRTHRGLKGKEDPEIAKEANQDERMIVALDNDYKDLPVKAGVIKMNAGRITNGEEFAHNWRPHPLCPLSPTPLAVNGLSPRAKITNIHGST